MLRYLVRSDMADILDIERASFPCPWTNDDFKLALKQHNVIGYVLEIDELVVGFMIVESYRHGRRIQSIAVRPDYRRAGLARMMVEKVKSRLLDNDRLHEVVTEVRESNLAAQLLFRACGFRCVETLPDNYGEHGVTEDGYVFAIRKTRSECGEREAVVV